jgi:hypothetical protein
VPVIQGYVHVEVCQLPLTSDPPAASSDFDIAYTIYLISRRSRYRAGKAVELCYLCVLVVCTYCVSSFQCNLCTSEYLSSIMHDLVLGMRYRRRGIDETGNCANYVETEQVRLKCTDLFFNLFIIV